MPGGIHRGRAGRGCAYRGEGRRHCRHSHHLHESDNRHHSKHCHNCRRGSRKPK